MNKDVKIVFLIVCILVMIGIIMIYSSSAVYAYNFFGDSMYLVKRHLIFLAIGVLAAILCMYFPVGFFRDNARLILLATLLLLILVLIPGIGSSSGGARRWIRIAGLGIQPSEIAKFAIIIYMADFTSRKRYLVPDFKYGFLPPVVIIGITSALILLEPDMGTSVTVAFIGFVILLVSDIKRKYITTIFTMAFPIMIAAIIAAPYRLKRVLAFLNPWEDPDGKGFQLIQSFIALGSGGIFGVGLGASKQKLFYLPQAHTDFIYSIIGEEMGFLGACAVLFLFIALVWYCQKLVVKITDPFRSKCILGINVMFAFEAMVNMGVSVGIFPTKGMPLPFVSCGGSSLVVHMACVGILLNMATIEEDPEFNSKNITE
ncbi:Cell division protein FtsW [Candidatus Omnitrophus magneticus]|uniref:Probable peptidoglycan glycosyltransferase FtsW n=1 Tax=Candidatus Omnitrophus magneticus TaxID=1609969 RepID=A0A0F0CUV4_9BACT|nr:Cell division protein FtsW [Candidatus Omnitrophus magneticus]